METTEATLETLCCHLIAESHSLLGARPTQLMRLSECAQRPVWYMGMKCVCSLGDPRQGLVLGLLPWEPCMLLPHLRWYGHKEPGKWIQGFRWPPLSFKSNINGNSLDVQWLGLGAFTAMGPGFNHWSGN